MLKRKTKAKTTAMPWWLGDGDEECPHCGRTYVYEIEFRCPDCDGPGCPHCKHPHAKGHHVCPACATTEDHAHG